MSEQLNEFDGVIIGAGHNALVLAGYMAKAGLSVALVEKEAFLGGGCGTAMSNFVPGFLREMHSQFHRNSRSPDRLPAPGSRRRLTSSRAGQAADLSD